MYNPREVTNSNRNKDSCFQVRVYNDRCAGLHNTEN